MKPYRILIPLVIVLGLVAGFYYMTRDKPIAVTVSRVDRGRVEATVANTRAGTVKAEYRARLAPMVGGQIATLPARKGQRVTAGQILMTLWNRDAAARLKLAEKEVGRGEATARQTCFQADLARRNSRRMTRLFHEKTASEVQYDEAVTKAKAQEAACQAARMQLSVLHARVDVARAELDKTVVRAPFAGIIAEINGEVGEFITPSPPGIATLPAIDLISMEQLFVSAPIDEIDAARIRPGMQVRITLDSYPGRHFIGTVRRIAPYVLERAKQARTVEVETWFDQKEKPDNLLPGYSADVEIVIAVREQVLRIPTESLLEGNAVFVLDEQAGRLRKKTVVTGLHNWRFTEIVSGLQEGEQVVTSVDRAGLADGVLAEIDAQQ